MKFFKSKKGFIFMFLVELLFLSAVIGFLFSASNVILNNEGKYRAFNTENLGLFMERVPSVDNNFYYEFDFVKKKGPMNVSVEFTKDKILLDEPGRNKKRYVYDYQVPDRFRIEQKFDNIDKLYFYKYGDKFEVFKKPNPDLIYYMDMITGVEGKYFELQRISDWHDLCLVDPSDPKVFVLVKHGPKDILNFNVGSQDFAYLKYNEIVEYYAKQKQNTPLKLSLIDDYEELLPNYERNLKTNSCILTDLDNIKLFVVETKDNVVEGFFA